MSQSPVSRNSNIERRIDRPKSVVGVIKGAPLLTSLLWSDPVGVRQLRAKALRRRAPRRPRMEENKLAHPLLLYDHCLVTVTQHPEVKIDTEVTGEGWDRSAKTYPSKT